jgi:hypothetical protein
MQPGINSMAESILSDESMPRNRLLPIAIIFLKYHLAVMWGGGGPGGPRRLIFIRSEEVP